MNDLIQPEWMQGFTATHPPSDCSPGNPAWKRGGPSPNPAGRPKGTLSKRDKIAQALNDDGPAVARVVIDAALAGDMQAAGLVLSRIAPPLKAQAERVQFTLSDQVPLSDQARQILQGVADGKLDGESAKTLIGCLNAVAGIRAVEDLESRLALLEAKAVN